MGQSPKTDSKKSATITSADESKAPPAKGPRSGARAATAAKTARSLSQNPHFSVEDLRDALENANDVIYTHDLDGNFTYSNAAAARIFGYSKEETLGLNVGDILNTTELARAKAATAAKLSGDSEAHPYLIQVRTRSGQTVPLELSTRLIYKNGVAIGVQGIGRDISERLTAEVALRESETRFRGVAENAPCAIVIYQGDRLLYANPAASDLSGYPVEELMVMEPFWNLAAPEYRSEIKRRAVARMRGKPSEDTFDFRILRKDGGERWVEFTAKSLELSGSTAAVVLAVDITERKKAEQALAQSEQLFRTVIESSSDIICILSKEGVIKYQSPSFESCLGYPVGETQGTLAFNLVHPQDCPLVRSRFQERFTRDFALPPLEIRLLHRDGHWVTFEAVSNLLYESGQVSGVLVNCRDISERVRQQSELRVSEERFRQLFERNLAGVFRCHIDGQFLACNEAFAHIVGYQSPNEIIGVSCWELSVNPEQQSDFMDRLLTEGQITNLEDQVKRKDGQVIWVLENVALIRSATGEPEIIEGTLIDITDRKRSETETKFSEERYRQLFQRNLAGVFVSTFEGKLLDCNDSLAQMFGYASREEIMQTPTRSLYFQDTDRSSFVSRLRNAKVMTNLESCMRRKDGSPIWVLENAALIEGTPETIQGTLVDITERKQADQALLESESKFRAVAETAASAIYIHNNHRFLYVNRASESISGYSSEELLKMNPFELVHPADQEIVRARAVERVRGQSLFDRYEYRIRHKNGSVKWVDFSASTIQFNGETSILGTAFDITERKRVEQMQRALYRIADRANAAEDLQEFFAAVHNIVSELMDARNFFIALYDETTELMSYPYYVDERDPAPQGSFGSGRGLTEYVLRQSRPVLVDSEIMRELQDAGEVDLIGSMFVDWMGAPLHTGAHTLGVLVAQSYSNDIRYGETELEMLNFVSQHVANAILRKRNQDALRASELRNRTLVQSAVYGIYRSNADGSFLDVNPAMVNMLGYSSAEEVLRLQMSRDVYMDSSERERLIRQHPKQARVENVEVKWRRKDGKPITVRLSGRTIEDPKGEIEGFEMIAEDVTERRALEEQLRQSQKMEAVGRLAGGVAHDFNNLLTVIRGYSELMLDDFSDSDPMRNEVEEIRKAADRAASLTRQLLAFSRQQVMAPKVLDLNVIVSNMERLLKRLLGEDIRLSSVLTADLGRVKADPGQVEQVIMNLAVNARDAMPEGGKLTVETANADLDEHYIHEHVGAKPGAYVMLAVSDTGSGMTPEIRQRIFEPFFTTKELGKGTGLGLSTVYGIVKQSEGYIWVYSEAGRGTSFKVYLPRVDAPADARPEPALDKPRHRGTETVLLVEDEDGVRALVRQVLTKRGYTVLEARHGGEALLHCERHSGEISLLLTDVVLEQMSGTALASRLSTLRPNMKVLYISGYTDDAIVHHGVTQGTHFLQKPFTTEALARKIRHVLDEGRESH